jgi:hypothetical protein
MFSSDKPVTDNKIIHKVQPACIFVCSPKEGDAKKCKICCFPLYPEANIFLLRFIQKQHVSHVGYRMRVEEAGLRKGKVAREQIGNVSL